MLLATWLDFERQNFDNVEGVESMIEKLEAKMPQQVKKRRRLNPEDPEDFTMEEYIDFVFPEDEEEQKQKQKGASGVSKLLQMARMWKENQETSED